jgi:hypothetical protein
MQAMSENKQQLAELGVLLEDMGKYLQIVELGCQDFSARFQFQEADKLQPLETLTQIIEGLSYYQKLLKSAAILLHIDFAEILYEKNSISSLLDQLCQSFNSILETVENKDYTLLTDLIEYDLVDAISISQGILVIVQGRYEERVNRL